MNILRLLTSALVTTLLLAGCQKGADEAATKDGVTPSTQQLANDQAPASTKKVTFDVEKMTCGACNHNVATAAKGVDGVLDAKASNSKSKAWVTFDSSKTDESAIASAITKAGYPATPSAGG